MKRFGLTVLLKNDLEAIRQYEEYYDNRRGILKLADVPVAINEKRIGHAKRAFRVVDNKKSELPIRCDEQWAEVRIPKLLVHDVIVFEH